MNKIYKILALIIFILSIIVLIHNIKYSKIKTTKIEYPIEVIQLHSGDNIFLIKNNTESKLLFPSTFYKNIHHLQNIDILFHHEKIGWIYEDYIQSSGINDNLILNSKEKQNVCFYDTNMLIKVDTLFFYLWGIEKNINQFFKIALAFDKKNKIYTQISWSKYYHHTLDSIKLISHHRFILNKCKLMPLD